MEVEVLKRANKFSFPPQTHPSDAGILGVFEKNRVFLWELLSWKPNHFQSHPKPVAFRLYLKNSKNEIY